MSNITKDYDLFQPFFFNRKLKKNNLKNLETSMSKQNLMHLHPIVVTKDYQVLDGQHRLEIARKLGLEVHYTKMPDVSLDILVTILIDLNYSLSRWGSFEFCELYCKMKKPEYEKFKKFQDKFQLDIHLAVPLSKERENRRNINSIFRLGNFVFSDEAKIYEIVGNAIEFLDVGIGACLIKSRSPHMTKQYFDAYARLMKTEGFHHVFMISQLKTIGFTGLISGNSMMSYYNQLLSLYKSKPSKKEKVA
jgi:hypothetical protein